MSSATVPVKESHKASAHSHENEDRRDFLYLATGAMAAIGACSVAWPFINSMNPAKDTLAVSSIDVDLGPLAEGQSITVTWRGKPLFLRHRTPAEITAANDTDIKTLRDPQTDAQRAQKPKFLIMIGICTHLGCVPLGQKPTDPKGDFGGWFCPCHGSHYDTAGRIRKGPAPHNLYLPPYQYTSDTMVRIG